MRSTELGVRAAAAAVRSGEVTAAALVEACLDRIRAVDPAIKAWIHLDETGARAAARAADAAVRPGATLGVLHGVPIGVKDIIDVADMPTTAGARAFAHTRPTRDATCVARLRAAGAIVLGKTHTTQFAYRDPAPTANPWNAAHTPGGSSSGSAAAVAARTVPVALGSQTVGSILRPAAYNGIVGLKGTNGLVPLDGVVPLGYSRDPIGPPSRPGGAAELARRPGRGARARPDAPRDRIRRGPSRARPLPGGRHAAPRAARRAPVADGAGARAGGSGLDGRRLALPAMVDDRRAVDLTAIGS